MRIVTNLRFIAQRGKWLYRPACAPVGGLQAGKTPHRAVGYESGMARQVDSGEAASLLARMAPTEIVNGWEQFEDENE